MNVVGKQMATLKCKSYKVKGVTKVQIFWILCLQINSIVDLIDKKEVWLRKLSSEILAGPTDLHGAWSWSYQNLKQS